MYVQIGYHPGIYTELVKVIKKAWQDGDVENVKQLVYYAMQQNSAYDWYVAHNDRVRLQELGDVLEELVGYDCDTYCAFALKLFTFLSDTDGIARINRIIKRSNLSGDDAG